MSEHARLSPSGSKGWMNCAGRLALEAAFPNESSKYSDSGTACHSVAAWALIDDKPPSGWLDHKIHVSNPDEKPDRFVKFDEALCDITAGYVDVVRALAEGHELHVEQHVEFSEFVGVPNQFGTADAIILRPWVGEVIEGTELMVIDLKSGFRFVEVEKNTQLMLYALGAYRMFDLSHDIRKVRLMIYQPQHGGMREYLMDLSELLAFATVARAAAQRVEYATAEHEKLHFVTDRAEWNKKFLHPDPNEDDCGFCRAMATCPAMTAKIERVVGAGFDVIVEKPEVFVKTPLNDDSGLLAFAMSAIPTVEAWAKAVRAEVERRLLLGVPVEGFGLELGRQGARAWSDEEAAETLLRKTYRLKIEDVYDLKLISPTSAEKLTKAKTGEKPLLTPIKWAKLQNLIKRSNAVPSVKPIDKIKTPYTVTKADESAFDVVPDEEQLW